MLKSNIKLSTKWLQHSQMLVKTPKWQHYTIALAELYSQGTGQTDPEIFYLAQVNSALSGKPQALPQVFVMNAWNISIQNWDISKKKLFAM